MLDLPGPIVGPERQLHLVPKLAVQPRVVVRGRAVVDGVRMRLSTRLPVSALVFQSGAIALRVSGLPTALTGRLPNFGNKWLRNPPMMMMALPTRDGSSTKRDLRWLALSSATAAT